MNRIFEPLHYFSPHIEDGNETEKRSIKSFHKKKHITFSLKGFDCSDIQKLKPTDQSMPVLDDFLLVNNVKVH